jgi:hypothetical protein
MTFHLDQIIEAHLRRIRTGNALSVSCAIDDEKPTCRYLCACPDLNYFRIADNSRVTTCVAH